jgi:uncharacterized membrane protein YfcA
MLIGTTNRYCTPDKAGYYSRPDILKLNIDRHPKKNMEEMAFEFKHAQADASKGLNNTRPEKGSEDQSKRLGKRAFLKWFGYRLEHFTHGKRHYRIQLCCYFGEDGCMHDLITIGVLLSFLFAAFLKGITGLGFSTISLPLLALFIEPRASIPLVILPSLMSNALVMAQAGRFFMALRRFWPLYLCALPGLFMGVYFLNSIESAISRSILGFILVTYALWAFRIRGREFSKRSELWLKGPVGICTGFINGLTGSQVLPVLPFMLSLNLDKDLFIQAINLSFTFSSLIMLVLLNRFNLLNAENLATSSLGLIPVVVGIFVGGRLRKALPQKRYRQVVLAFLAVIGLILLIRAWYQVNG